MSLLFYLAQQVTKPIVRKSMFTAEHVLLGDYMPRASFLYETGAVLGYTFHDRIATFAKAFSEPGRESEVASHLGDTAASKLQQLAEPPNNFHCLFFKPEATRIIQVLQRAGRTTCSDWSDLAKVAKQKLPVEDVLSPLSFAAAQGIGLGSRFPDLTEQLLTHQPDPEAWREARSYGLDIPASPPERKSIEQRQAEARLYISATHPELLSALGL